jgi:hypothetical protein
MNNLNKKPAHSCIVRVSQITDYIMPILETVAVGGLEYGGSKNR